MRIVIIIGAVVVGVLVAAAGAVGWYYAGEVERQALAVDHGPPTLDLRIVRIGSGDITLETTAATDMTHGDWRQPGRFRLQTASAAARVDVAGILDLGTDVVTRALSGVVAGLAAGEAARLDVMAFTGDPMEAHGLPFTEIEFPSEIGGLKAWLVDGRATTWAVFVHGRGVGREEGLRVLPALAALGLPTMMITYRNDVGAPRSTSGRFDYGQSEWRDLEAAVAHALEAGADDVVLVGYSMGGAISMNFLYRSALADRVRAVVLDSPMLDFGDVVYYGAERMELWGGLTVLGKVAASVRYGLAWSDFDYLGRSAELAVPILLIHGDADQTVHVRTSDALAAARSDLVSYIRLSGVGHVRGWNADPAGYERAVAGFLAPLLVE